MSAATDAFVEENRFRLLGEIEGVPLDSQYQHAT